MGCGIPVGGKVGGWQDVNEPHAHIPQTVPLDRAKINRYSTSIWGMIGIEAEISPPVESKRAFLPYNLGEDSPEAQSP